jgi:hypothetical protein
MLNKTVLARPKPPAGSGVPRPISSVPIRAFPTPLTTPQGKITAGVHPVLTNGVVTAVKNKGPVRLAPVTAGIVNRPGQVTGKVIAGSSAPVLPVTPKTTAGKVRPTFGAWLGLKIKNKFRGATKK